MNYLKKYYAKLFFKQWSLGFLKADIREIIRSKKTDLAFTWLNLPQKEISYADPFIFKTPGGTIHVLFESFTTDEYDGKISRLSGRDFSEFSGASLILDGFHHLSYPFTFQQQDQIYVLPENAFAGSVWIYQFDADKKELVNKKEILNLPLLDATIVKHHSKYWLFGTLLGEHSHSKLYIYYSDKLTGPYTAHVANPVKNNLNGTRSAGSFIEVDGILYRPAQNCANYYGESITINKVLLLNESQYREEEYMILKPDADSQYNFGIHTINSVADTIVVDGQRGYFQPLQQVGRMIKRKLSQRN